MTNETQPKKKLSTGMLIAVVVGGCFAFSLLMTVGQTLGYGGVALGLLAVGGGGYLLVKGPPERRKLAAGGVGLGVLFIVFGLVGAGASRRKAEAEAAATAAANRKAADDKVALEKAATQLAALDANATSTQLVTTCSDVAKLGAIPAQHQSRCGDAFLAEGQAQLTAKHPAEAVALLEKAATMASKKDEAISALTEAKVAVAVETGAAEAVRAEKAAEANDLPGAMKIATAAAEAVASAVKLKPDDASLKALAARLEAVLVKADPQRRSAAEAAAFGAMSPQDHLKAAKDALADGYDTKTKAGGRLDDAQKHLAAIAAEAPETKAAKELLREVDARRQRVADTEKMAEVVRGAAGEDTKFEYKGGALLVTEETSGSGSGLSDVTVQGHTALLRLARDGFSAVPGLQSITVVEFATYNDVRGNEKRTKVGEFMVTRRTSKGINWENMTGKNTLKVIDKAWVASGVYGVVE